MSSSSTHIVYALSCIHELCATNHDGRAIGLNVLLSRAFVRVLIQVLLLLVQRSLFSDSLNSMFPVGFILRN